MNAREFYDKLSNNLVIMSGTSINERLQVIKVTDQLEGNYTEDDRSRDREEYGLSYGDNGGSIIYEVSKDRGEYRKTMMFVPKKNGETVDGGVVTIFEEMQWYDHNQEGYGQRLDLKYATFINNNLELTEAFEDVASIGRGDGRDWQSHYDAIMSIFGDFGKQAMKEHRAVVTGLLDEDTYNMFFGN